MMQRALLYSLIDLAEKPAVDGCTRARGIAFAHPLKPGIFWDLRKMRL
jgi:hypothetical protein